MKHFFLILCLLGFFHTSLEAQTKQDSTAIQETVLNYIEGWETGDSARLALAHHPQLVKRGIVPAKSGQGTELLEASYQDMVTWTVYQKESKKGKPQSDNTITITEIGLNIANVTCISTEYVDYLHLARTEKGWKILNAVWEPNYQSMYK